MRSRLHWRHVDYHYFIDTHYPAGAVLPPLLKTRVRPQWCRAWFPEPHTAGELFRHLLRSGKHRVKQRTMPLAHVREDLLLVFAGSLVLGTCGAVLASEAV